jgi:hypothetical protein
MTKCDLIQRFKDCCTAPKNNWEIWNAARFQTNRHAWNVSDAIDGGLVQIRKSPSPEIELWRTIEYCKKNNCNGHCSFRLNLSEYDQLENFFLKQSN